MTTHSTPPTDPEDLKIITLARAARARTAGRRRARAYATPTGGPTRRPASALPHLQLSAVAVAVAMAVSSGAAGLEAVAVGRDDRRTEDDRRLIGDLAGAAVAVWPSTRPGAGRREC